MGLARPEGAGRGSGGEAVQPLQPPYPLRAPRRPATLLTLVQGEASPQGLELGPPYEQLHALVTPNLLICKSSRDVQ